jgi:myo-inositol-1(or 4)-monophosphatase
MTAETDTLTQAMIDAARAGARCLMEDFAALERLEVRTKRPADFVSEADLRAEQAIREVLTRATPTYGLLLEESGVHAGQRADRRWLVDPLDGTTVTVQGGSAAALAAVEGRVVWFDSGPAGLRSPRAEYPPEQLRTTNFLHGIPHFCVSIALEGPEGLLLGLILDPNRDELFLAARGRGATLCGRPLRVSRRASLDEAVLATGIPVANWTGQEDFLRQLGAVMPRCAGVRRFGSAALDLAYVAAGRYDGYWERALAPWDVAAGALLVKEAGGQVTDLAGGPDWLRGRAIAASNGALHGPLLSLVG